MAVHSAGPSAVDLRGAPDDLIGTPHARGAAVQAMHIDLTQDILDELLACTRSGKPPQILFGRNPRLEVGDKVHRLDTAAEHHRHELYRYLNDVEEGEEQPWSFTALVNHSLEVRRVEEKTAELDRAVEDLKQRMATINEQKEASKTIVTTELASTTKPQHKPGHLRTPSLLNKLKHPSRPGSPSLSAVGSPALAPRSAPTDDDHRIQMATRKAVTHFLAVKPRTAKEVVRTTQARKANVEAVLPKIAKRTAPADGGEDLWQLTDSAYKALDLHAFNYDEASLKAAQENAIRAFDRQRVPRTDKLWQMLLPEEDRGKGIVLSRLADLSQGPRGGTPTVKPSKLDRKTGLPKKEPPKKERREKKSDDSDEKAQPAEERKKAPGKEKAGKETSGKPPARGNATPSDRTPLAANARKPAGVSNGTTKPNGALKASSQQASKPKNPSPLGSSPPTNASDVDEDAIGPNSQASRKRKAGDHGPTASPAAKVRKVDGPSRSVNGNCYSHTNGPTQKPEGVQAARSSAGGVNGVNGARHGRSSGSPSPDDLQLSWRQTVDMAAKFKRYYGRYEKLYHQLADNPKPPSQDSRQELMRMHERLSEMKREISVGSLRG